jgi:hypothetical protein
LSALLLPLKGHSALDRATGQSGSLRTYKLTLPEAGTGLLIWTTNPPLNSSSRSTR